MINRASLICVVLLFCSSAFSQPASESKIPTITEKTAGTEKYAGYFNFYWDAKRGKIWLEIDKWETEFLYMNSLPAGVGSNDLGLDRGQIGDARIVKFVRSGPKILLMQPNDPSRSAFYLPRTKNFPRNTEVEVTLTFTGDSPGQYVRQVVPTPEAITVRQHHSFIQLPDDNYKPRVFDPRAGFFGISYMDYATPISEPIMKRFIARHRLQKKNPNAATSEAVAPIV